MSKSKRDHVRMEQRRLKAVKLFERGLGASEVGRRLGVRRQSAHEWMKNWQHGGKGSLRSKGSAGRKPKLDATQCREVVEALLAGPRANGYATEVWTLPRVAALIKARTSMSYHPSHVSRWLRALGFSCQRPERRAIERDEKAIAHWKRVQWPRIKKKRAARGV